MDAADCPPSSPARRRWLACGGTAALAGAWPWRHAKAAGIGAAGPAAAFAISAAFTADRADRAVSLLASGATPHDSGDVALDAPDLFEDGANVPLTVRARAPSVRRLALLIDRNPTPLVAVFTATALVEPVFHLRVKMAETSDVRLLGWSADGDLLATRRRVAVVEGGCGDEPIADTLTVGRLPGPMRIRAERRTSGPGATVRVLMRHPMETGLRKDGAGRVVPAWHITTVEGTLNGASAFSADWGNAVAANPYLEFTLPTARAGDSVGLRWVDNRGGDRGDSAIVA